MTSRHPRRTTLEAPGLESSQSLQWAPLPDSEPTRIPDETAGCRHAFRGRAQARTTYSLLGFTQVMSFHANEGMNGNEWARTAGQR